MALISALATFHEADAEPWLLTFVRRVRRGGLEMAIAALFCGEGISSGVGRVWLGGCGEGEEKEDARLW
jgi:hypothetical protein